MTMPDIMLLAVRRMGIAVAMCVFPALTVGQPASPQDLTQASLEDLMNMRVTSVSKKEQKKRFLARLEEPEKNWKFSAADVRERECWDDYMEAYEDMIRNTAAEDAPWYVVPADNKWFTRLVISTVIVDALASLKLEYPKVDDAKRKELEAAKKILLAKK